MFGNVRAAAFSLLLGLVGAFAQAAPTDGPVLPSPATRSLQGSFLVAPPGHEGGPFGRSVVFLLHHSDAGAMGVIINKPLAHESLKRLIDGLRQDSRPRTRRVPELDVVVRYGGPVEPDAVVVIHSPEFAVEGTRRIGALTAVSPVADVLAALAEGRGPRHYRFFAGYAGWAPAQLEAELGRNWWVVVPADSGILFDDVDSTKWYRAFERRPVDL